MLPPSLRRSPLTAACLIALLLPLGASSAPLRKPAPSDGPLYTPAGEMLLPADYRQWVFLTSGLDISYVTASLAAAGHSVFQNVFVNPSAYRSFLATGAWPDKTVLVLEIRGAEPKASIDRRGQTQTTAVRALEVHVKDAAGPPHGWAFYEFATPAAPTAPLTDRAASCYTCHEQHAAVDTTFVQFYPTLIDLARSRATLSPAYLKEIAAPAK